MNKLLPFALAAAAGAMVYVVIEEVIPEANASGNGNAATVACIGGLCLGLDDLLKVRGRLQFPAQPFPWLRSGIFGQFFYDLMIF